jgi:D-alanyl-lipoteichoic acid acyltransferase DltB (MBOAT superfamily)
MNFVTVRFAVFFLVVLCCCRLLRDRPALFRIFLPAAGLFFYAAGGLYALPLLPAASVIAWSSGRLINASSGARRRRAAFAGIASCLFLLGLFKYYEFFWQGLYSLPVMKHAASFMPAGIADWTFPVGLSFYSFQAIAYIVGQYRNPEQIPASFMEVLSYLSFFPTVMAGPIMRPGAFFPQAAQAPARDVDAAGSTALILSGLFKKVVLASFLSEHAVRNVFTMPELYSSGTVLLATYAYAMEIYCDFSGYTDLALGVAGFMGFTLPRNFNAPYLSFNIQDFWRRWHITLSCWFRDYLYIPLGGNRKGPVRHCINLLLTMALCGLWHGAHPRFVVWGLLHGAALALLLLWRKIRPAEGEDGRQYPPGALTPARFCAWFATFHFVCAAWIFFRAEDVPAALDILERIALWNEPGETLPFTVPVAVAAGFGIQWAGPSLYAAFLRLQSALSWPCRAALAALLGGLILRMGPDGVLPFIYFSF